MNASTLVLANHLDLEMPGKMIVRSKFWLSSLRCEYLIRCYLKILNYKRLKTKNGTGLKCKYQVKQISESG